MIKEGMKIFAGWESAGHLEEAKKIIKDRKYTWDDVKLTRLNEPNFNDNMILITAKRDLP